MLFEELTEFPTTLRSGATPFEILERSNRPHIIQRRNWIEEWFSELPREKQHNFESRLRANREENFRSALFEMQVYNMLRRLNCRVDIEPTIRGTRNRLDFHAIENRDEFYIEATICGLGQGAFATNPNEEDVVEKLKRLFESAHSDVSIFSRGTLRRTLSTSRVVRPFEQLLDQNTEARVSELYAAGGISRTPSTSISEGDWSLEGRLRPHVAPHLGGHIIGPSRAGPADGWTYISGALYKKARKWRQIDLGDLPLIIAVNVCHSEFDWFEPDIRSALFSDPESAQSFHGRLSGLSGALLFEGVGVGNEIGARVKLYANGESYIPECLHFLLDVQRLEELLGLEP